LAAFIAQNRTHLKNALLRAEDMKKDFLPQHAVANNVGQPVGLEGVRAMKAVAADEGVSGTTIWRRSRAGLIEIIRIANRPYVTLASLQEFYRRAVAGEFARPPAGAAGASAQARRSKEGEQ
jgi:hypothetical protein